eukprot:Opistho-2@59380
MHLYRTSHTHTHSFTRIHTHTHTHKHTKTIQHIPSFTRFRFLKPKCHALLLDPRLNSADTVRINIAEMLHIAAIKFHCHVRALPAGQRTNSNPRFFACE